MGYRAIRTFYTCKLASCFDHILYYTKYRTEVERYVYATIDVENWYPNIRQLTVDAIRSCRYTVDRQEKEKEKGRHDSTIYMVVDIIA